MPEDNLPEQIDPFRFAEQNRHVSGSLTLKDMPRLSANLHSNDYLAEVDMQFGKDEEGTVYLKGHVKTSLILQCQRCMEPVVYEIIADFLLGVVKTLEEANALSKRYEPTIAKEGSLVVRDLIEDELILNLPIIPKHEPEECNITLPLTNSEESKQEERKNPFHVLHSLKRKS